MNPGDAWIKHTPLDQQRPAPPILGTGPERGIQDDLFVPVRRSSDYDEKSETIPRSLASSRRFRQRYDSQGLTSFRELENAPFFLQDFLNSFTQHATGFLQSHLFFWPKLDFNDPQNPLATDDGRNGNGHITQPERSGLQ